MERDWNQSPPQPQGIKGSLPSPSQDLSFLDKGLATPLPPGDEEQVQLEQEEEPQQVLTDEFSEEGKICEQPQ